MDILIALKASIAGASASALIVMAFLAMTPATWFIAFTGISLTWLFGEGVVKNAFSTMKAGMASRNTTEEKKIP